MKFTVKRINDLSQIDNAWLRCVDAETRVKTVEKVKDLSKENAFITIGTVVTDAKGKMNYISETNFFTENASNTFETIMTFIESACNVEEYSGVIFNRQGVYTYIEVGYHAMDDCVDIHWESVISFKATV